MNPSLHRADLPVAEEPAHPHLGEPPLEEAGVMIRLSVKLFAPPQAREHQRARGRGRLRDSSEAFKHAVEILPGGLGVPQVELHHLVGFHGGGDPHGAGVGVHADHLPDQEVSLFVDLFALSGHHPQGEAEAEERLLARRAGAVHLLHNVGGLPEELGFNLIEPLRDLFKDEVRKLGEVLGLPDGIIWRHPFPGPGLAVRCLGEITKEKLDVLRDCDEILLEEIVSANLYRNTDQVFAVLLPVNSVGVMGDGRTYESVVAIRAVETQDFMTADWARIPYDVLSSISNRIINEVRGVNRVVYDISSKPPATIEWE